MASNRLPVRLTLDGDSTTLERSDGGLATALGELRGLDRWIGWPGAYVPPEQQAEVAALLEPRALEAVFLTESEIEDFYGHMCNDMLWPLLHYFVDRLRFSEAAWKSYVEVNERFARTIARSTPEDGRVWIHDFHLMLVPAALRSLRPDLSIGFFLHTPFPSSETFRTLPVREEVLRGLLGADYIGFQTGDYARHFRSACLRVLGLESEPDTIDCDGRRIGVGANPIGVAVRGVRDILRNPRTEEAYAEIERRYDGVKLVLGVERLDYTKGIPQKIQAFERLLEDRPERIDDTTLLEVLVPSRLDSPEYVAQREEIELHISRVNGRYGRPGRTPVEYIHRGIDRSELYALYRRADVMAVTPLRDGMNLVAHEFALAQASTDGPGERSRGSLVLSELAGAAQFLPGALLVNPWNVADIANRIAEGLELDATERARRIELMGGHAERLDCHRWAAGFLSRLDRQARQRRKIRRPAQLDDGAVDEIAGRFARATSRTLLLDYDGTLRELVSHPALAAPTTELDELLEELSRLPSTELHIVSGRKYEDLERWFDHLPVYLCAEHGFLSRAPGGSWRRRHDVDLSWMPRVERFLRRTTEDVPGSLVEKKTCGVAWHYRQAEREYGSWRARELLLPLEQLLRGAPAEILSGHAVIEVRARGVDKGAYVRDVFPDGARRSSFVLAAGDDETDIDLYRALPRRSISVHVAGPTTSVTRLINVTYSATTPAEIRGMLRRLVPAGTTPGSEQDDPAELPARVAAQPVRPMRR